MADVRPEITSERSAAQLQQRRDAALRRFVRQTFGFRGTLRLHRAAIGLDLLRAPLNLLLAPVFLAVRLLAVLARALGRKRVAGWLASRRILLETAVAGEVRRWTLRFLDELRADGLAPDASAEQIEHAVDDYVGTRGAVAEMTTTLFVLLAGYLLFHAATPGVLSLAGPVAELRAHRSAVEGFPLGQGLGRLYYGVFPTNLGLWRVVLTALALAGLGALVTTFAGVLADPVQVATGTHRRRLQRLLDRLDRGEDGEGLPREHLMARMGDLSDLAVSLLRILRG